MIGHFADNLRALGITDHAYLLYAELLASLGIIILAFTAGWMAGHLATLGFAGYWEKFSGYGSDVAKARVRNIIRNIVSTLVLGLAFSLWLWDDAARVLLALAMAISIGLLVFDILRLLRLPVWASSLLGVIFFIAILGSIFGGVEPVTQAMDKVGFDLGKRRISLLSMTTILLTFVILLVAVRILSRITSHSIDSSPRLDAAQKLLGQKIASVVILIAAFFLGLDVLGIDLTALGFFSGAFGLAVGFGLQKTIGNLFAGIILLMDRSVKPGDIIVVGDSFGWVNKIGVRAVSVLTNEGKEHLIPNENLMTTEVENWSFSDPNVRIHVSVGVSYASDMTLVKRLMFQAASETPRVLKNPHPVVWMTEFGDSSVNWEIRVWINDPHKGIGNVKSDVLQRVWFLFKQHDVQIPFPQRDLHVKNWPPPAPPVLQDPPESTDSAAAAKE